MRIFPRFKFWVKHVPMENPLTSFCSRQVPYRLRSNLSYSPRIPLAPINHQQHLLLFMFLNNSPRIYLVPPIVLVTVPISILLFPWFCTM
jgi:hypothetical protein